MMANGSVEEDIQFSLEAIDLDEDIEMIDELFCNEDVEERLCTVRGGNFKLQNCR